MQASNKNWSCVALYLLFPSRASTFYTVNAFSFYKQPRLQSTVQSLRALPVLSKLATTIQWYFWYQSHRSHQFMTHGIFVANPIQTTMVCNDNNCPQASHPTIVPNCNSLIESPIDTPTTENCKNKSYDCIVGNDCPNDDNNDIDDVDCFPWQDKQPVLPQDISPTTPTANTT